MHKKYTEELCYGILVCRDTAILESMPASQTPGVTDSVFLQTIESHRHIPQAAPY